MAKDECKNIPNFTLFNGIQQNPALSSKFIKSSFQIDILDMRRRKCDPNLEKNWQGKFAQFYQL